MYKNGSSYRNETHYALEAALLRQMSQRSTMPVGAWIAAERQLMLASVNRLRLVAGRDSLPVSQIERVERLALGHVDYAHKFALYCAELVTM